MNRRRLVLIALCAGLVALGIAAGAALRLIIGGAPPVPVVATGAPSIGGPFELVDHTGRTVTERDFAGRYLLVYFGYTFCPDVCPLTLSDMAAALDLLGDEGREIQPLFITIDPARDTMPVLAGYVASIDPRLVGLTGTAEQIAAAAKAYRVYYARAGGSDANAATGATDYLMDHTSIVYLMGPDRRYLTHFTHGTTPEEMAEGIRRHR